MNIDDIKSYFLTLQNTISGLLQKIDPDIQMQEDTWEHKTGGGGITRAYIGSIIEKAGVNFSHVRGDALPHSALMSHRREWAGHAFQALGVSVVIHPNNPYVPTVHFNERFFSVDTPTDQKAWWFGGGMDLTPY
jgi:coproporphyrinogen III oxidase